MRLCGGLNFLYYWYHFDSNGIRQTGWQKLNGDWYYFNSDGIRQVGWQQVDGKWYHLDSNGIMETGWVKIGTDWYYFHSTGERYVGWLTENGKTYHFNSNGIMDIGWKKISDKWYHFDSDGVMNIGWKQLNGNWYYFHSNGVRYVGWLTENGKTYHFDSNGIMQMGWQKINSSWYYFNTDNGEMNTKTLKQDKRKYEFFDSGELKKTEILIDKHRQEMDSWCWAACAQMVGTYNTTSKVTQAEIVEHEKGEVIDLPGISEEIADGIKFASGYTKNAKVEKPALDFSGVVRQIDNNHPLVMSIGVDGIGFGHSTVCVGYDLEEKQVILVDTDYFNTTHHCDYADASTEFSYKGDKLIGSYIVVCKDMTIY